MGIRQRLADWLDIPRYERQVSPDGEVVHLTVMDGFRASPAGFGALMSVDYAACEQTKARSMASLPVTVVRRTDEGRENLDHPIARLLNGMANEEMSAAMLMATTVLRRDTFGNAHWWVEWNRGVPVAIWPIESAVEHTFDPSAPAGYRSRFIVPSGDSHVPAGVYFPHEVVNIPTSVTKDGVKGESLARIAGENIGLSIDLERFYRAMLSNGNHHLGHVEVPEGRMPPEAVESLQRAIEAKRGVMEAGKTPIFGWGAKWVTNQQTMRDASVIEQQQWVLQQVCRATNVPPWKVYDGTNATYSGGQQQRIDYVTDTIVPDARVIEMALQPVLRASGLPDAQVKFNIRGLMRGDDASRSAFYRELGYIGALTRADIRELEDMDPIDGLDRPLFPVNYGTVNPDGSVNVYGSGSPADNTQIKEV